MTLSQVIKGIERIASGQPSVNMIVRNDIFRLNACSEARYGVFGWLQGEHTSSLDSNDIDFRFTFFYVDRLTEDRSNEIEVQSVGIETLDNIIRIMDTKGLFINDSFTIRTFNQRFLDECAGAFCNVTISVPGTQYCSEDFSDLLEERIENVLIY